MNNFTQMGCDTHPAIGEAAFGINRLDHNVFNV